jgi:hypothetical protein
MIKLFRGVGKLLTPIGIAIACLCLMTPVAVLAQGVGLSGNFYRQYFEMAPGETSASSDIYVVVFNNGDSPVNIDMVTEAPDGVTIALSQDEFTLDAGKSQTVNITVQVGQQAVAGEYTLSVSADVYREGTGIKITGGGQQQAKLSILGEAGKINISSVTHDGKSFPALIYIYKSISGELTEVRTPETGNMETRLNPGDYIAQAKYSNITIAQESFTLASNEEKSITLVCSTLNIEEFAVTSNLSADNRLTSAKISYTINNIYQPLDNVSAMLYAAYKGQTLDEIEIVSFSTLDAGSRSGSYNYIPAAGWQSGSYTFVLKLKVGDDFYDTSDEKILESNAGTVSTQSTHNTQTTQSGEITPPFGLTWLTLGLIAGGILLLLILIIILVKRRK